MANATATEQLDVLDRAATAIAGASQGFSFDISLVRDLVAQLNAKRDEVQIGIAFLQDAMQTPPCADLTVFADQAKKLREERNELRDALRAERETSVRAAEGIDLVLVDPASAVSRAALKLIADDLRAPSCAASKARVGARLFGKPERTIDDLCHLVEVLDDKVKRVAEMIGGTRDAGDQL